MDPARRLLRRITTADADQAMEVFELLMGSDVAPRRDFIVSSADEIDRSRSTPELASAGPKSSSHVLRRDPTGRDVVDRAAYLHVLGQVGERSDARHVDA